MSEVAQTIDAEMYAIALCVEGLEPIAGKPRSLRRVFDYIGMRYLDNLQQQLAQLEAEIKVLYERQARLKYEGTEAQANAAKGDAE